MPTDSSIALNLANEINTAFSEASATAAVATLNARQAVSRALECGRLLNLQKDALPHGIWQDWLAANCPAISAPTARRYMKLAKHAPDTDLTDATSLRQAYLATGVLPEAPPREATPPDANAPVISFTRGLDQFRRWYHRRTEDQPLAKWSPQARRLLRNELAWFVKLHDDLAA